MNKLIFFLSIVVSCYGQFVSNTLGSNMVLQRSPQQANLFGKTSVGATVSINFNSENYGAAVAADGSWIVSLPPTAAGGPYDIAIVSSVGEKAVLSNVLFGDVWVCSGQSNMQFTVESAFNNTEEIQAADNYPNIRVLSVGQGTMSPVELPELQTLQLNWSVASSSSIGGGNWTYMSAVCWFFGRDLYNQYKVPIGLISTNWGGTIIQAWSSTSVNGECNIPIPAYNASAGPNQPTVLYNAMIYPFLQQVIYGAIWYQGESNVGHADQYACLFPAMIADWRASFGHQTKFPFLFVQLAPWIAPYSSIVADLRAAQLYALSLPSVGFATAVDLGDPTSPFDPIHPRNKQEVSSRLVLAARNIAYGETSVVWLGPVFKSAASSVSHGLATVLVTFATQGQAGLVQQAAVCPPQVSSNTCANWEIKLSDGKWYTAEGALYPAATNVVSVTMKFDSLLWSVKGVRYGYALWPLITVYSAENLPAIPFEYEF